MMISGVWYRAVRHRPPGHLCVLIMLIRTDFAALRGVTGPLGAGYGQCYPDVQKAFIV